MELILAQIFTLYVMITYMITYTVFRLEGEASLQEFERQRGFYFMLPILPVLGQIFAVGMVVCLFQQILLRLGKVKIF